MQPRPRRDLADRRRPAALTRIASLLVRRRVTVHCRLPAGSRWPPRIEGITFYVTDEIYLRRCARTPLGVVVFAHELIHAEHPHWPHWKVYRLDDWYARTVVAPKLRVVM